ncbi:MAG: DUF4399 domain-containing protein [Mangrovicoccus sp.]
MNRIFTCLAATLMAAPLFAGDTPAPEGAELYFVNLEDGATVSSPVTVIFGLKGMGVAPAGTEKDKTGHHHILIDREPLAGEELNQPLPADDHHKHFGGGQTETSLELAPGSHSLQLVLGDWSHIPHNPPVTSEMITITVK